MTADDVRARFEAEFRGSYDLRRDACGTYIDEYTLHAWWGYRAALADRDAEVRELVEALKGLRQAHLKQTGHYPLPQCDDYAAMRATDAALAKFTHQEKEYGS